MTERSDYRNALRDVLRQAAANEKQGYAAIKTAIEELRAELQQRVLRGEINAASVSRLLNDVDAAIGQVAGQLDQIVIGMIQSAGEFGAASVTAPLSAAGAAALTARLERIRPLVGMTVDLIRGQITDAMRSQIRASLRMNALGAAEPHDAMLIIDNILGTVGRGGRARSTGILYDAERILRTETGRTFNMAANDTMQAAGAEFPGLRKRWVSVLLPTSRPSHIAAHIETRDNPIPYNEPFNVGGELMMNPQDPNGSPGNTINCRCRMLTVPEGIGVIDMPGEIWGVSMFERTGEQK